MNQQPGQDNQDPQKQGTGFVNLSKYLGANNGTGLSNSINQGINNQVGKVQSDLQTSKDATTNAQTAGQLDSDANKQEVSNTLGNVQSDPSKVTQSDYDQFKGIQNGSYTGPTGLNDYSSLSSAATGPGGVAELGQDTRTAAGRGALLQQFIGNPQYKANQKNFDNMFLGSQGFAPVQQSTQQVGQQVNQANNASTATAQKYAQDAQNFQNNIFGTKDPTTGAYSGGQLNTLEGNITSAADAQAAARNAANAAAYSSATQGPVTGSPASGPHVDLNPNSKITSAYTGAGSAASPLAGYFGVDPRTLYQQEGTLTGANEVSPTDLARLQALTQLGGSTDVSQYTNAASIPDSGQLYNPNTAEFQSAVGKASNAYQTKVSPLQAQLSSLEAGYGVDPTGGPGPGNAHVTVLPSSAPAEAATQAKIAALISQINGLNTQYDQNQMPAWTPNSTPVNPASTVTSNGQNGTTSLYYPGSLIPVGSTQINPRTGKPYNVTPP